MALYLILMGVQGAGKGVQAQRISNHYGIPHVSTGDLFRAMKTREDELARRIQQIMAEGKLISDEITNEVVRERLEQPDAAKGVILDGYPRTAAQAAWLDSYLGEKNEQLNSVLLFDLDLYTAFRRAFGRVTSSDSKTYNIYTDSDSINWKFEDHPTGEYPARVVATEKATGAPLIRRPDDANAGAIIKRIDTYLDTTRPLVTYYRQQGTLVEIDASKSIDEVWQAVQSAIES
jgi:adenylate kinase